MGADELWVLILFLLAGLIYLICGAIFYKVSPKKINYFVGYRTRRSMNDQRSWDFAQKYSARLMVFAGIVSMAMGLSFWMVFPDDVMVACIVMIPQLAMIIPVIAFTEVKLKRMQQ